MGRISKLVLYYLTAFLFIVKAVSAEEFESKHFKAAKLSDGVYGVIHSFGGYAVCNSGIIDLGEKVLIFDTFLTVEAAEDLKKAAEFYTGRKVSYVVNSHAHNDHIRGNQVFRPSSIIISTDSIRQQIEREEPNNIQYEKKSAPGRLAGIKKSLITEPDVKKRSESQMWIDYYEGMIQSHSELVTTLPDLTFNDKLFIHGSRRTAELHVYSNAHSLNDIILYLPDEEILFTGDLVFNNMHPFLPDGNPDNWKRALQNLLERKIRYLVPGHGEIGNTEEIYKMIAYIDRIAKLAMNMKKEGKTLQERNYDFIPEPFAEWHFPGFFKMNMNFMLKRLR